MYHPNLSLKKPGKIGTMLMLALLMPLSATLQAQDLVWAKRAGGGSSIGRGIAVDGSGNSYVTGLFEISATFGPGEANQTTLSGSGSFVAKYNPSGALIWAKSASSSIGRGIAVDGSGNSNVTGVFFESVTFGPGEVNQTILSGSGANFEIFVAKYNPNGVLVWAKSAGGSSFDQGLGIAVDGSGNSYVTGSFEGSATFGLGEANQTTLSGVAGALIFVAKYNAGQSDITATPTSHDYEDVEVDSSSSQTFTIGNLGTKDLQVSATSLTGPFMGEFSIVSGGGSFTLPPLLTRDVVVSFNPTSAGSKNAKLRFTSDDPDENPFDISLTGRAFSPDIAVTPNAHDFGNLGAGSSAVAAFAVTNEGHLNLTVSATTFVGANASEFSIESGGAPFTLPFGATRNVVVRFTPTSDGHKIATLRLASDDPDENPADLLLSGHGLGPDIEVAPSSHDYGIVGIGAGAYRAFEVKNVCHAPLNVTATTLVGPNASEFSFYSGAAPFTLAPGAFRNVVVRFAPTAEGQKFATLQITSDDNAENPVEIFLTGKGVIEPVADIAVNPATLNFGSIGVGGSVTQTMIVTNESAANLTVSATTLLGANAGDFAIISGGGPFTLAPGGNRNLVLRFNPATSGSKTATLQLTNNDPDENPLDVPLTGNAIGTAVAIVINEVVTDPQQDWNDSNGGNGIAFDNTPGTGAIGDTDEWIELFNIGTQAVNLTAGSGWTLAFNDGTNATLNFTSPGTAILLFSAGGSVTNFQPGEYLIIGNPPGSTNDNPYLVLRDQNSVVIDDVEIGNDFEGDGAGDGAPDGGASDGNATGLSDEAVARLPNGNDTENDVNDFAKQAATIGASNAGTISSSFTTAVDESVVSDQSPVNSYQLEQNYPNPFLSEAKSRFAGNPETEIRFAIPQASHVVVKIFNLAGAEVRTLVDEPREAGYHRARWDGKDKHGNPVASGVYLYRLQADHFSQIKKMSLLR